MSINIFFLIYPSIIYRLLLSLVIIMNHLKLNHLLRYIWVISVVGPKSQNLITSFIKIVLKVIEHQIFSPFHCNDKIRSRRPGLHVNDAHRLKGCFIKPIMSTILVDAHYNIIVIIIQTVLVVEFVKTEDWFTLAFNIKTHRWSQMSKC
jgi:hypothetical protein